MAQQLSAGEQAQQLEESLAFIRQQEALMRKCLDQKGKLLDAIKHASTFLGELRTSSLTPKQYYELYIAVFDALGYLAAFLKDDHQNHHLADIYELVQYAGNIVPRLYLMITVGTVYMSIPDAPVKEIMKDMMEMCRGVQHPVRGLFLRYFLSQRCRDFLPVGTSDGPEGNLQDSIQFTITNFIEMNKLWVRLQHQGHSRERDKRTRERQELQVLVGSNLVRISQLEGIDKQYYRTSILPAILEQVVQCRDVLAQEYLLDVICQVFPDEFHLHTLDLFLTATTNLNPGVSIKRIILSLVNRLADYAIRERVNGGDSLADALAKASIAHDDEVQRSKLTQTSEQDEQKDQNGESRQNGEHSQAEEEEADGAENGTPKPEADDQEENGAEQEQPEDKERKKLDLFEVFWKHLQNIIEVRPDIPPQDVNAILAGIARLTLNIYGDRLDYIDKVFEFAVKTTEQAHKDGQYSPEIVQSTRDLLLTPIEHYDRLLSVLSIPNYLPLLHSQAASTQRYIAGKVGSSALEDGTPIDTAEDVEGLFGLIEVIIKDQGSGERTVVGGVPGGASTGAGASDGVESDGAVSGDEVVDQSNLAKIVHLIYNKDTDTHSKLLRLARQALSKGGDNIKFTYPALVTAALKLVRRYQAQRKRQEAESVEKIGSTFKFIQKLINDLYQTGAGELGLRLYVNAASVADQVESEEASYEFYAQAFTIYEEAISDSRSQFQALSLIAGALQSSRNFSNENYDTLVSKCALYGSKLLKKPDQCRAVYLASHLWWATEISARGEEEGKGDLFRDDKRVLECLQRALRVADACMDVGVTVELFVEILNRYLYFFDRGNSAVSVKYINGLIDLIQTNLNNQSSDGTMSESPRKHFERTLDFITTQKEEDERFREIVW